MIRTAINNYHPRVLLAVLAAALVATGSLALVGATPARAVEPSFEPAPNSPFSVGSTPTTVTNADFNGDGKEDLAAQNSGSNSVSVLLGNGDGAFQTKQDFTVGSGPSAVTSADLDGDNKADLAVANWSSNNVSVLLGNGDGTFKAKQDFTVGISPSSVISADFDGNAKADLAVANYSTNKVSVLLGNGDGSLQAKQDFSINAPCTTGDLCPFTTMTAPNQVITKDLNADGKADLATANFGACSFFCQPGGISVLLGNGNGTFQNAQAYSMSTNAQGVASSITSADFNTDGKADLAATNYGSNVVSVRTNNGNGTFSTEQRFSVGSNPSAVTSADLDGDGKADLAVSNFTSDNASVLWGSGGGSFQAVQNFPAGDGPIFVIGAYLNADSVADLALANQNSNNVSVLLNTREDSTAPTVGSVSPADAAKGVALSTNVEATFSEAIDPRSISDQTFTLTKRDSSSPVAAHVIYDSANKKATLDPALDLEANTSYTATIKGGSSGVKDAAGNALSANKVWTFSTVDNIAPPAPVITSPSNNSIDTDGNFTISGTAEANSTVELFEGSDSRSTATVNASGEWSKSLTGVAEGSYTYTAKAKDAAGNTSDPSNPLTVDVKIPPLVNSVLPPDKTQNVDLSTNVEVIFSEEMDEASVEAVDLTTGKPTTFTLLKDGSTTPMDATVSYDAAAKKATLDPSSNLASNTTYTATIKGGNSGATDSAGNALKQDYSWTFTTVTVPLTVVSYTPTETTGVPRSTQPTATFSTDMDERTITDTNIKFQVYNKKKKKWIGVAHTVSYDADSRTVKVTPSSTLAASKKYRVTITTNVKSSTGVALDQDGTTSGNQPKSWIFTTGG